MAKETKPTALAVKVKQKISNKVEEKQKELDDSSNSSLENASSESYISLREDIGEENEPNIFDSLTDSESEKEEEPEYLKRKTLPTVYDFLGEFEGLPNISDISDDSLPVSISETIEPVVSEIIVIEEEEPEQTVFEEPAADAHSDDGRFVNPLTGSLQNIVTGQHTSVQHIKSNKSAENPQAGTFSGLKST